MIKSHAQNKTKHSLTERNHFKMFVSEAIKRSSHLVHLPEILYHPSFFPETIHVVTMMFLVLSSEGKTQI